MAKLFLSYSHKDEALRGELEVHLTMLQREGTITVWHDRKIDAGDVLDGAISAQLTSSDIILLLVSPDFLASSYCYDIELKQAMIRHEDGNARVIPVILRPCDWHYAPFSKLLAAPKDGKPITKWSNRDEAFLDVVRQIRRSVTKTRAATAESEQPASESDVSSALKTIRENISLMREVLRITEPGIEKTLTDTQIVQHILRANPSSQNKSLLAAFKLAGEIAHAAVHEQKRAASSKRLTQVRQLLEELKEKISIPLRSYQERLATLAVDATIAAIEAGQPDIGTLFQTLGSGLSMTLATFVAVVAQHTSLRSFVIVIATDRSLIMHQLHQRMRELCSFCGRPLILATGAELFRLAHSQPRPILVTTYQSMSRGSFPGNVLLVEFDVHRSSSRAPKGAFFISFTGGITTRAHSDSAIIGSYSLKQAIKDGFSCPILFERRSVFATDDLPDTETILTVVAKDIYRHFYDTRGQFHGKAVVIVRRISTALRLTDILNNLENSNATVGSNFAAAMTVASPPELVQQIIESFSREHSTPAILVTVKMWNQISVPIVGYVYVTCRLTPTDLAQLPGIVCRPSRGKPAGIVVDYSDNNFNVNSFPDSESSG